MCIARNNRNAECPVFMKWNIVWVFCLFYLYESTLNYNRFVDIHIHVGISIFIIVC